MTLSKAREILTLMSKRTNVSSLEDCVDAVKLGNEALRAYKQVREVHWPAIGWRLLRGETEE